MKKANKKKLVDKFESKYTDYILQLGNPNHPEGSYVDIGGEKQADFKLYNNGKRKYNKLKEKGKAPIYCRVLENMWRCENERLRGDISKDVVYTFLIELKSKIEKIAQKQYIPLEKIEGELDSDPGHEHYDVFMASKEGFLIDLISCFENRGRKIPLEDNSLITPKRYKWLEEFSKKHGNDPEEIEELVREFPDYFGDYFFWECD